MSDLLPIIPATSGAVPPRAEAPIALQAVLPAELCAKLPELAPAEARKIVSLVHRTGTLPARCPTGVRRGQFEAVRRIGHVPALAVTGRIASRIDPFVRYTMRAPSGELLETVRIPLERPGRFTVCVSSQVGCALGCVFCKTGRMGLVRNLSAWEIVEQVRLVRGELPAGGRVHGVVFQGMGEPLSNVAEVVRAARILSEPSAQAIDARCITISTAGLPTGIRAVADALPNVRLAVSIGSALPEKRAELIPIGRVHSLSAVLEAAGEHARRSGYAPLFAYTLLSRVNDGEEDAVALATMIRDFADRFGVRPRLSLIPYNRIDADDDPFERATDDREAEFVSALRRYGVASKRRYSGGADVDAACGQLAGARDARPGD